jgi:hypothetical protein
MALSRLFGKKCMRCGVTRTKDEFEGLPTCDKCEAEIQAEREVKRPCPNCHDEMTKSIVLNIVIDKCPSCHGAWLDGRELDLLKKAIEDGASGDFTTGLCIGMVIG